MTIKYPSDISRESFELIKPILLEGTQVTKPRAIDLYDVFCGLIYVLKTGCQWNMIPSDYPAKSTIFYYYQKWNKKPSACEYSLLEKALKKMRAASTSEQ